MKVRKFIKKVSDTDVIGVYNSYGEFCGNYTKNNFPTMLFERKIKDIWTGVIQLEERKKNNPDPLKTFEKPKINITLKGE